MIDDELKLELVNFIDNHRIDFNRFVKILIFLLKNNSSIEPVNSLNFDYIDAFVALGGE